MPGCSFFRPSVVALLGTDLLQLVDSQRQCTLFTLLHSQGSSDPPLEQIQQAYAQGIALEHQLLSLPFDPGKPSLTPQQDAVRLTLFVFAQPTVLMMKPLCAFARAMAGQIKEALGNTDLLSMWNSNSDLLLWVLFIGAFISRWQDEWGWFVGHIRNAVRASCTQTLEELEELLLGFFYIRENFGYALHSVWRAVSW